MSRVPCTHAEHATCDNVRPLLSPLLSVDNDDHGARTVVVIVVVYLVKFGVVYGVCVCVCVYVRANGRRTNECALGTVARLTLAMPCDGDGILK